MAPAEQGVQDRNDVAGADAGGKSTEEELSGDQVAMLLPSVEGRRNVAMAGRRRTAAIQAQLNQIKPSSKASVSVVEDRQAAEKSRGCVTG